jgi:hypothetical protein
MIVQGVDNMAKLSHNLLDLGRIDLAWACWWKVSRYLDISGNGLHVLSQRQA